MAALNAGRVTSSVPTGRLARMRVIAGIRCHVWMARPSDDLPRRDRSIVRGIASRKDERRLCHVWSR